MLHVLVIKYQEWDPTGWIIKVKLILTYEHNKLI